MKKLFAAVGLALISLTGFAQSEIYPQHFDLEEINITAGPLKEAQDLNIRTLLEYDADRLLTPFVRQSGLGATTDKASRYYQWEQKHPNHANWGSGDFRLDGHVGGHYLTAMALAYASCHDTATRQQILERIQYMIPILEDCQNAWDANTAGMYGFLGGQPCNDAWTELAGGQIPNFWATHSAVPLYCEHKILAGLRDLVLYCDGDVADRAKAMFRKLCDFHLGLIAKLTDQQLQGFLDTEHGGVNETLADAYRLLGDEKYLAAAKRYSHNTMVDNMQTYNRSFLTGKHANTQVPKYIGFIRIAQEEGTSTTNRYRVAAKNFWKDVAENRTVCIGGNSMYEHFISENDGVQYVNVADGPESCNSNNMLKLSEDLFDDTHDSRYADFYEGTMYNHMLSTIDPETGGYVYFTPLRPQSYRIYSKVNQDMWCCVGTGMENHVKYGHFTYTHTDNTLFVNLFTPSTLDADDYALTQETQFPDEQGTKLTLRKGGNFTLAIRKPSWVAEGYAILVNGAKTDYVLDHGYATIERSWKKGDVVEVALPMTIRYETCPNLPDYIAFKRGPILLAARTSEVGVDLPHEYALGERMGHSPDSYAPKKPLASMPMLIGERSEVLQRIDQDLNLDVKRTDDGAANYTWQSLQLAPYYSLHHSRVSVYFYQATYEKYQQSTWAQAEAEQKKLDDRTIDRINMGLQQEEAGAVTYS
ncbi:MAG: glycoside hydrolase family 127 protein, partial [Bacteroidaceae bacterium]|nr:glycoside hydrolase family 127 protein [Bacteroidaceae bacterium]